MTVFVIWQLIVTLDSIRNSCDVFCTRPQSVLTCCQVNLCFYSELTQTCTLPSDFLQSRESMVSAAGCRPSPGCEPPPSPPSPLSPPSNPTSPPSNPPSPGCEPLPSPVSSAMAWSPTPGLIGRGEPISYTANPQRNLQAI